MKNTTKNISHTDAETPVNRRIRNASSLYKHGIHFKSKLELMCYEVLREHGFKPEYEKEKFVLLEGFRPGCHSSFYKTGKARMLEKDNKKVISITYTPDFTFYHKNVQIIIEAKGYPNDTYAIKKKLFKWQLQLSLRARMFFEVHSKRSLEQAIEIIKSL